MAREKFAVGDAVEGGDNFDDYDVGRVTAVYQNLNAITVAWANGTQTTQDASLLRKKGTRPISPPSMED